MTAPIFIAIPDVDGSTYYLNPSHISYIKESEVTEVVYETRSEAGVVITLLTAKEIHDRMRIIYKEQDKQLFGEG